MAAQAKPAPQVQSAVMRKREAEMRAGRARIEDRQRDFKDDPRLKPALERGIEQLKEDEQRIKDAAEYDFDRDKRYRDMAGAEIADQAQTELEAVQHLADRRNTIITAEHEAEIERLEGDADPKAAEAVTTDVVTAQAVNQPTVLAANRGVDTENQPLNTSGRDDSAVNLERQEVPEDKHVPKNRPKAEKVARGKIPPVAAVVKHGAVVNDLDPSTVVADEIVSKAPDDMLGE